MYIETDNDALQALYDEALMGDEYDPPGIEFSETGVAQVKEAVGERLVEQFDDIHKRDTDA
jgi:hypothetical protein